MTTLHIDFGERGYDVSVGSGLLGDISRYCNLDRRAFIVTDSGVPREYAEAVARAARVSRIVTVPMGEGSKSPETYTKLLEEMQSFGMTRTDCAVAVGGGVVGDLTGFVAATYMRGIDFYNIPTTVLSEVDSSIGGKVAINLGGVKNTVGAFYQPRAVVIDTDTLKTLPERQIANGLAESVKMALTSDKELFEMIEGGVAKDNLEEIIVRSLKIKQRVVELDEREGGIRKILNFGHTYGHGIESAEGLSGLLHGECVALGMLPMSSEAVKSRLVPVLKKLGLPTVYEGDKEAALSFISHDKKKNQSGICAVFCDEIGTHRMCNVTIDEFRNIIINH